MKTFHIFKKSFFFKLFVTFLVGVFTTALYGHTLPFNCSDMLSLLKKHRDITMHYRTQFANFIAYKNNKNMVATTLKMLYIEHKKLNSHLKNLKHLKTGNYSRKKINSLDYCLNAMTTAIKDLEHIKKILDSVQHQTPSERQKSMHSLKVTIELDSERALQKILNDNHLII